MASSINASTSGPGGVITTADNSGILQLQSGGVTQATISSSGLSTPAASTINTANTFGFKNRLINGNMVIDQRNAGASVTGVVGSVFATDRWKFYCSQASKITLQQNAGSITPPSGYTNYLGATVISAYSPVTNDEFDIYQNIEGLNMSDLAWGTANAKTITISFQVYSSLTGTFGGALRNSAGNRSYPFSYTVNSANTWTSVSIIIPGDTTGTWLTNNSTGVSLIFSAGAGSNLLGTAGSWAGANYVGATGQINLVSTNGATFYFTGVQLEVGSQATSFDFRSYTTELQLCQRYLPAWNIASSGQTGSLGPCYYYSTANAGWCLPLPVTARVPPTGITFSSASAFQIDSVGSNVCTNLSISSTSQYAIGINSTDAGANSAGWGGRVRWSGGTGAVGQLLATGCEL